MKFITEIIMFFIVALVIFIMFFGLYKSNISEDNSCKNIGFEEATYKSGLNYCEDLEGNLYSIKMDCNRWGLNCKAKQIEIRSYKE